jgi:segregation and condensation protein B
MRILMNESHIRNVIEAALLAAGKPLQPAELVELFEEGARPDVPAIQAGLAALNDEYSNRGIEIKETAAGFRIQVRRELANEISRLWPERPARYSRALLETLALIAYRQPITRAEIEAVRGVAVNPNILKTVIERNWVRVVGHRDVPGRPELLGTTREFLDYFGLKSLDELPPLAELKVLGDIKVQFELPDAGPIALLGVEGGEAVEGVAAGLAVAVGEGVGADAGAGVATEAGAVADGAGDGVAAEAGAAGHGVAVGADAVADGVGESVATGADAVSARAGEVGAANDADASVAAHEAAADHGVADGADAVADGASAGVAAAGTGAATHGPADGDGQGVTAGANSVARGKGGGAGAPVADAVGEAQHEAEEFAATVDAELAAGDDDGSDEDELSAAGPGSSELVAGPRDLDD